MLDIFMINYVKCYLTASNCPKVKNRLKELRKFHNWSQADLARALKISRQAVNGFESGKFTPSLEMAFKIALLFDVAIESVFIYQEKNLMQNLLEKVENFTQWLPRGERFTDEAIAAIEYAQYKAALSNNLQVEPRDILCGLMGDTTNATACLLKKYGLVLNQDDLELVERSKTYKINRFSRESQYILELALNAVRLKQKKYIDTEHLLLGLIQLIQLGNDDLIKIFHRNKVNVQALVEEVTKQ